LTYVYYLFTLILVIKTFKHKGLQEIFEKGNSRKIQNNQQAKGKLQLTAINAIENLNDLNVPGWRFHSLKGFKNRYSLTVTGNYRITFDFKDGDAYIVNYEDYH